MNLAFKRRKAASDTAWRQVDRFKGVVVRAPVT